MLRTARIFTRFLLLTLLMPGFSGAKASEPVFYPRPAILSSSGEAKPRLITEKSSIVPVWYEDFDGGLPEGWLNVDLSGYALFMHSFIGPQGEFSQGVPAIKSTSASNGFMILDSDLANSRKPGGLTNAFIQSPPINLSNQHSVMLSFQHFFRYCCNFQGTQLLVEVSNDGQTWVSFDVKNGVWPNNLSPNPIHQLVNITEVAAGQPQVWIRFRKTGASHYFWMIDDVSINTFTANDLELFSVNYGGYTIIPGGQQQAVQFSGLVRNVGGNTQSGIRLHASVNTYLFSGQSNLHNQLSASGNVMLNIAPEFSFPGRGIYDIAFKVTQNQLDNSPENNLASARVIISDTVYARDQGIYKGEGIRANPGQAFETGNIFEIIETTAATSVSVAFHEQTQPGAEINARIYVQQGNSFLLIAQSAPFVLASQHISKISGQEAVWVTIPLGTGISLQQGNKYLVAVNYNGGQHTLQVSSETPRGLPQTGSSTRIDGIWQTESNIPMVRLNLGKNRAQCASFFRVNTTPAYCGTNNGQATVIPLSGFAPYTYMWNTSPAQTQATAVQLSVGQHQVLVWDHSGCHDTLMVTIASQNLEARFEALPSNCGAPDGQATVIPLAGFEPYTFQWAGLPEISGPHAAGLLPGSYQVLITDNIGCQGLLQVQIPQSQKLLVETLVQDPVCLPDNGSILLQPIGGIGPFKYVWSDFPALHENQAINLSAGTYKAAITDQQGCVGHISVELKFQMNEIKVKGNVTPETCGLNNASILVELEGATEPVNYKWNTGASIPSLVNIGEGTYMLQVTDAWGCQAQASFVIANQGQKPEVSTFTLASPGCGQNGGTAVVIPKNQNANLTYLWSTGQQVSELYNLMAGIYHVTVTNANDNCQVVIPVVINDAAAPPISSVVTPVLCYGDFNGGITVSVAGGGQNLQYKWLHGPVAQTLTNLGAGTYIVTVNVNECFNSKVFNLTQPQPLHLTYEHGNIFCSGHITNISVSPKGGTSPYSFYWSTAHTATHINNLPAGRYWVQVTDFHECTYKEFITITSPEKIVVEANLVIPDAGMENGSITLSASGGTGQLNFLWNNGKTTQSLTNLSVGTYSVVISDQNGCTESLSFNLSPASIDKVPPSAISLYPNPALNVAWLSIASNFGGNILILLHDASGRVVREFNRGEIYAGQKLQLDLSGLSQGVYFISINGPEISSRQKLIKH